MTMTVVGGLSKTRRCACCLPARSGWLPGAGLGYKSCAEGDSKPLVIGPEFRVRFKMFLMFGCDMRLTARVVFVAFLVGATPALSTISRRLSSESQTAKLTASDADAEDFFGFSMAIAGNLLVVGAYGNDDAGDSSGSA